MSDLEIGKGRRRFGAKILRAKVKADKIITAGKSVYFSDAPIFIFCY